MQGGFLLDVLASRIWHRTFCIPSKLRVMKLVSLFRWISSLWQLAIPQRFPKPASPSPSFLSHWKDGKFFNPWKTWKFPSMTQMPGLVWKMRGATRKLNSLNLREPPYTEYLNLAGSPNLLQELQQPIPDSAIQICWIGHATVLVQMQGFTFITDPVFAERASPLSFAGPKRYVNAPCRPEQLPPLDFILLSHNHYDHLDYSFVQHVGNDVPWYVPLGTSKWFNSVGVTNVRELDWWEETQFKKNGESVRIVSTPVQHWTKRGLFDDNSTLWCSWSVHSKQKNFFFSGDTGYCSVFSEIGEKYGPFDVAAIPIGAYEPRHFMKAQHVNVPEAVQMHIDLKSKHSLGIHWGTFLLTCEDILEPAEILQSEREDRKMTEDQFFVLKHGGIRQFQ